MTSVKQLQTKFQKLSMPMKIVVGLIFLSILSTLFTMIMPNRAMRKMKRKVKKQARKMGMY